MAVRDDDAVFREATTAVLEQDWTGPLELVVAVAASSDRTAELADNLAAADARVRVVANPGGSAASGLNRALAASRGDVIVRVDGHAVLPRGYIRRAVRCLDETGADNVGGLQQAEGTTPFERAVAAAMTSRFGAGDARYRTGGPAGPTDTVYLGVFRREALERVGGYDETLARNQDYELNHRLRAAGGSVYFDPELRVRYRPRSSLGALARQYFAYGQWKRVVVHRHPRSLRWRQLAAPAAVVANVTGLALAGAGRRAGLAAPGGYAAAVLAAAAVSGRRLRPGERAWLPVVYATMHGAWGLGFLLGPRRGPGRV